MTGQQLPLGDSSGWWIWMLNQGQLQCQVAPIAMTFPTMGLWRNFPQRKRKWREFSLKNKKPKQNPALLAQQVMSLKPAWGSNWWVLPTSLFVPVLLAQAPSSLALSFHFPNSGKQKDICLFLQWKRQCLWANTCVTEILTTQSFAITFAMGKASALPSQMRASQNSLRYNLRAEIVNYFPVQWH